MSQLKDYLTHYRKKIERGVDEEKKLYILRKLRNVRVTKEVLQETGIAKTVKQLTKERGKVGEESTVLIELWKECIYRNASIAPNKPLVNGKNLEKGVKRMHSPSNGQNVNMKYEEASKKPKYDTDYLEQEDEEYVPDSICLKAQTYTTNSDTESVEQNQESSRSSNPLKYIPTTKHSPVTYSEAYDPEKPELCQPQEYKPTPIPNIKSLTNGNGYHVSSTQDDVLYSSHNSDKKTKDTKVKSEKPGKDLKCKKHAVETKLKDSNGNNASSKSRKLANHEKPKIKSSELTKKHESHLKDVNHQKKPKLDVSGHSVVVKKKTSKTSTEKCSEKDKVKNGMVPKSIKKKIKVPETEVFTSSEVTFEDCLGLNDIMPCKKKKPTKIIKAKQSIEQTLLSKGKPPKEKDVKTKMSSSEVSSSTDKVKSKSSSTQDKVKLKSSSTQDKVKLKSSSTQDKVKSKSSSVQDKMKSKSSASSSKVSKHKIPRELQIKPKSIQIDESEFHITLPEITANYRPLPRFDLESSLHGKKALSNEDAIIFTSSKKDRTAVYSGRRNNFLTEVPTLFETCTRVLIDNMSCIEYTGGVPYFVLKPVLERCTPQILYRLEDFNPYLLEDTHELWQQHCVRDFRSHKPEEGETWRDMYIRIIDEREKKLEKLTSNIKGSISSSNPARRAKLAYIDSFVKPPRDVARKQAKFGTAHAVNHTVKPPSPKATVTTSTKSVSPVISEKSNSERSNSSAMSKKPPKPAPLMAKTLKAMKQVYRR